jgi:hypothetical protein
MANAMVQRGTAHRRHPAPNHRTFVDAVLRPLAARAAAGEDERALAEELYERSVHHWAVARARALAYGLPAHADAGEVTSQVLRAAWDACLRIDWSRVGSWPTLLERKVAHARIEAARAEDWLSRRERVYRRRYQSACASLEQATGRTLSHTERLEVATTVAPQSNRVEWARELVAGKHPSTVAELPDVIGGPDVATEVERQLLSTERSACLRQWLDGLARQEPALAQEVRDWVDAATYADRPVPAHLARRLLPFAGGLVALVVDP